MKEMLKDLTPHKKQLEDLERSWKMDIIFAETYVEPLAKEMVQNRGLDVAFGRQVARH